MAVDRYDIVISQRGAQQTARDIESIGTSAQKSVSILGFLRSALVVFASIKIATGITEFLDSLTLMHNRIRVVVPDMITANAAFEELVGIANRARQPLTDIVDLYARVARSAKNVGVSQREVLGITESLSKLIAVSGATTAEGTNALIQFGQALASNRFSGDEFRSISENLPPLMDQIIAGLQKINAIPGFKGTLGELRELGKQGKLTSDILIRALQAQEGEIQKLFELTKPTIGQGFNVFANTFSVFVDKLNQSTDATGRFARLLITLANNFDRVAAAVATAVGAVGIPLLVRLFVTMNPILRIIGLIVAGFELFPETFNSIANAFSSFTTNADGTRNAIGRMFDAFAEGGQKMQAFISAAQRGAILVTAGWEVATEKFGLVWRAAAELFVDVVNFIIRKFSEFLTLFTDGFDFIVKKSAAVQRALGNEGVAKAIEDTLLIKGVDLGQIENEFAGSGRKLGQAFTDAVQERVQKMFREGTLTPENASLALAGSVLTGNDRQVQQDAETFRRNAAAQVRAAQQASLDRPGTRNLIPPVDKNAEKLANIIRSLNAQLQEEINLLDIIDPKKRELAKIEEDTVKTLISRGHLSEEQARKLVGENTQLGQNIRLLIEKRELDKAVVASFTAANGPARDYQLAIRGITKALDAGEISQRDFNVQVRDARIAFLDTRTEASAGFERFFLKLQKDAEDSAKVVEESLTKAFDAVGDTIADFVENGKFSLESLNNFAKSFQRDLIKKATNVIFADVAGQLGIGKRPDQTFLGSIFGTNNSKDLEQTASVKAAFSLDTLAASAQAAAASLNGLGSTGALQGSIPPGGSGAFIDNSFLGQTGNGIGGGGFLEGSTGGFFSRIGDFFGNLFGFAEGGSFQVGAQTSLADVNGVDNRLIAFRARDGETVSVTPAGQSSNSTGHPPVNVTIVTKDANSFNNSRGQVMADLGSAVARARQRNT